MTVTDLCNLLRTTPVNSPKIQAVNAATTYVSKVEEGDLFFAQNDQEAQKAVKQGAFAIVFADDAIKIHDSEIAWIKVDDLADAALRIMRYVAARKKLEFTYLTPHQYSFLKMILADKRAVTFLSPLWQSAFEQVVNSSATRFVGNDRCMLEVLDPEVQTLRENADGYIINDTLLRTSFKLLGYVYQEKELIPFHFESLSKTVAFCENNALAYTLKKLRYTQHFYPVFFDYDLTPLPFGRSEKAAIFVDNIDDILKAKEYIRYRQRWIKTVLLAPANIKIDTAERLYRYEDSQSLRDILRRMSFHYALVYKGNKEVLQYKHQSAGLFR